MKSAAIAGCGCVATVVLLLLAVPLLFVGVGAGASANTDSGQQVIAAGGLSCDAAVRCQEVPAQLPYVPRGFFPDSYTNPPGECTSWAAALWPGHHRRGITWSGDAWEWYTNAAAQGYVVSLSPSLGSVAVFDRTDGAGEWGHVAIVVATGHSSIRVTEMNEAGRFVVDERTISLPDPQLLGFIPVPDDAFS